MANYERGSKDDVRVFDGGGDEEDTEGSQLPMLIVISLLVLVALGGFVWLAYNNGVAHGRADAAAKVAQTTTEAPAAPTDSEAAPLNKSIKIYQQPAGSDDEADQPVATDTPAPLAKKQAPAAAEMRPAETKPAPVAKKVAAPPPEAVSKPAPEPVKATPKVAAEPIKATPKAVADAPPAKLGATAAATGGAYVLQIGAYKSEADAEAAWKGYQTKHGALVSGMSSDIQKADLGDKGVWYRLRAGSFPDKDAAGALCDKLKADGGACFPAK
jgi:cell division protein FtsN